MTQALAQWIWRAAMLAALAWIGAELHQLRTDINQPPEEDVNTASAEDYQNSLDDVGDELDRLNQKVDALMIATAQLKK